MGNGFITHLTLIILETPKVKLIGASMTTINLIEKRIGNCYSMPSLAKILALEMKAESKLAIAPRHLFLKTKGEGRERHNMELTNGSSPYDDAYLVKGYVNKESVVRGVYLVGIPPKQEITIPLLSLAQSLKKKIGYAAAYDFVMKCSNLAIEHSPTTHIKEKNFEGDLSVNVNAYLLIAETIYDQLEDILSKYGFKKYNELMNLYLSDLVNLSKSQTKFENVSVEDLSKVYPLGQYIEDSANKEVANVFYKMQDAYANATSLGYKQEDFDYYLKWLDKVKKEALKQNKKSNYLTSKKKKK